MNEIKQLFKRLLSLSLVLGVLSVPSVKAEPIVNGAGNDGELANVCQAGMEVCWARVTMKGGVGNDYGIRVTVVETDDEGNPTSIVSTQDYSNEPRNGYFYLSSDNELVSKMQYYYSDVVSIKSGYGYKVKTISPELPWLVNAANGSNNFEEVKEYFLEGSAVNRIARDIGMTGDEITSTHENGESKYKLLIEPVAYVIAKLGDNHTNIMLAMTPTEMALYNKNVDPGYFFYAGPNLFYSVLAKAMYLQEDELGFTAKSPTVATYQNDDYIIDYLGMAVISFGDGIVEEEGPVGGVGGGTESATYRYNTDVFVSVTLTNSGEDRGADNPINYTMVGSSSGIICGNEEVQIPEGESQRVWCTWTTPNSVNGNRETITVKADGAVVGQINVTYQQITGKEPPDTNADDKAPSRSWTAPSANANSLNSGLPTSNTWTVWYSENGHTDGTLEGKYKTWNGVGSEVELLSYTRKTRYWIEDIDYYCSGAEGTDKAACEANEGAWVRDDNSHWSSWSSETTHEEKVNDTADKYYFYKYGSYESEYLNDYKRGCGSNDNYCEVGGYTKYTALPDKTKKYQDTFKAVLVSFDADITPNKNGGDPDGTDRQMKSGYAIDASAIAKFTAERTSKGYGSGSDKTAEHTGMQNVVVTFPEFDYVGYQRVMDISSGTNSINSSASGTYKYQFAVNHKDIKGLRRHFTPIWFPDNKYYDVRFRLMDFWTPGGCLQMYADDDIKIKGSMWDDIGITGGYN